MTDTNITETKKNTMSTTETKKNTMSTTEPKKNIFVDFYNQKLVSKTGVAIMLFTIVILIIFLILALTGVFKSSDKPGIQPLDPITTI